MGLIALAAGLAFAYWVTTDSSNPAAASATSLSAPNASAAEASATSVKISWTAGSQPTGANYVVVRNPGAGQVTVCTVSASTSSCTDSGLSPATTYSYSVTAILDAWQSSASTESFTTSSVNVSYPANNTTYGTNWTGSITGSASEASNTTISSTAVAIENTSTGKWWNGSTFSASSASYQAASGTTSWSYGLAASNLTAGDNYSVTAEATDSATITATSSTVTFTYNASPPVPSPPTVSAGHTYVNGAVTWTNGQNVSLSDTVTPGGGTVTSVSYYWCTTSSCNSSGNLIGTSTSGGPTWSVPWSSLPASDGVYYVVAVATDSLSNSGTSTTTQVGIDRTPPAVSTPSVNGFS